MTRLAEAELLSQFDAVSQQTDIVSPLVAGEEVVVRTQLLEWDLRP